MKEYQLGAMELRFAELIWSREPVASGDLVKLCKTEFDWKKSTTYTMLRRLCERKIFQNKEGVVTSLLSQEDLHTLQSEKFVEEIFEGSLPQFLAAFTKRKKLTEWEIAELEQLIEKNRR